MEANSTATISFDPCNQEESAETQWDFQPWDQAVAESDWRTWKPVPGSAIVFERDRLGRVRPKAVVIDFTPVAQYR